MFPTTSSDVAVTYHADWSWFPWTLDLLVIGVGLFVVSIAAQTWASGRRDDEIPASSIASGVAAAVILAIALWQTARHLAQYKVVVLVVLLMVAAVALVAHSSVRSVYLRIGRLAAVPGRAVGIPAATAAVIAIGVLIGDGLNRVAAEVPTTVAALVAVAVFAALCLTVAAKFSN